MLYGDPATFDNLDDCVDLYIPMAKVEPNEDKPKKKKVMKVSEEFRSVKKEPETPVVITPVESRPVVKEPDNSASNEVPAQPKRKRGRPRKNPLPEETTNE